MPNFLFSFLFFFLFRNFRFFLIQPSVWLLCIAILSPPMPFINAPPYHYLFVRLFGVQLAFHSMFNARASSRIDRMQIININRNGFLQRSWRLPMSIIIMVISCQVWAHGFPIPFDSNVNDFILVDEGIGERYVRKTHSFSKQSIFSLTLHSVMGEHTAMQ